MRIAVRRFVMLTCSSQSWKGHYQSENLLFECACQYLYWNAGDLLCRYL